MDAVPPGYEGLKEWADTAPVVTVKHPSGMYSFTGRLINYISHESIENKHEVIKLEIKDFNMIVTVGETWEITDWVFKA
jgi:hypothetical protein